MTEPEEWRPVPGWGGRYEASSLGRIRNSHKIMKPYTEPSSGYQSIVLYSNGVRKTVKVQLVIASAFLGERPQDYHTAHLDGNPSNNVLSNLAYVTQSENHGHMHLHGTAQIGERNGVHKLTEEQARLIIARGKPGDPVWGPRPLSKRFGVHEATIQDCLKRRSWRYLSRTAHEAAAQAGEVKS